MSGANYRQHYSMKAGRRKVGNYITRRQLSIIMEETSNRKIKLLGRLYLAGQVYKTFTFQLPIFIGLSPAFAIVLVRAGVLLQVTKVETPNVTWSSLHFLCVFSRHYTCPDPHDLVS
jgi:hypothetical protein